MLTKHYLSVLAIFNNESHIMREWMHHYVAEGVDFFYLINNFSSDTDMFLPILQEHVSHVKLLHSCVPNETFDHAQVDIYNSVFQQHIKGNTEWLIVVDFDEFMYASDPNSTLKQELQKIENSIRNVACVRVPWKMFGSNGHVTQPRSVVKHFTKRERYTGSRAVEVKNVFKPDFILCFNIHEVFLDRDCKIINMKGESKNNYSIVQTEENIAHADIRLNHYVLQSKEYWTDIKMKRDYINLNKEMVIVHTSEEFNERDSEWNEVTDDDLYSKHRALYDSMDEVR